MITILSISSKYKKENLDLEGCVFEVINNDNSGFMLLNTYFSKDCRYFDKKIKNGYSYNGESFLPMAGWKRLLVGAGININLADKEDLIYLPEIGEKTAVGIIRARQKKNFNSIEELLFVKGIGKKKFAKIKKLICTDC